jgi:hypothetical protein
MLDSVIAMPEYRKLSDSNKRLVLEYYQYMECFCLDAIRKFCKGRLEHDEDLTRLDCEKEIKQELFDLIAYQFIKNYLQHV